MTSLKLPSSLLSTIAGIGMIGGVVAVGSPAHALCLTGGLNTTGNNCQTFNNTGTTTATVLFTDLGLNGDQFLQIGFGSASLGSTPPPTTSSGFSVSNIEYSLDGSSFTAFGTGAASQAISNNGSSSFTALYTPSLTLGSPITSNLLYVRYTLPSTITTDGQLIGVYLRSNSNGNAQANPNQFDPAGTTLLSTAAGDNGTLLTRDHTLDLTTPPITSSAPGPLPLLGGASAFAFSRRLRRRLASQA